MTLGSCLGAGAFGVAFAADGPLGLQSVVKVIGREKKDEVSVIMNLTSGWMRFPSSRERYLIEDFCRWQKQKKTALERECAFARSMKERGGSI